MKNRFIYSFIPLIFSIILFLSLSTSVFASEPKVIDISIVSNTLRINSCLSQLQPFMGYKGYVNGTEILSTGLGGGFPCFGGDTFISNLSGFVSSYSTSTPLALKFDFYSDTNFTPPAYATFTIYYDGSQFSLTPPVLEGKPSVFFLPGFQASRLYRGARPDEGGGEKRLWEPFALASEQNIRDLFLDKNGESIPPVLPENEVYTKDVINEAFDTFNIYKSFTDELEKMKSVDQTIADYAVVPYDWRFSFDDLLSSGNKIGDKIYYTQATGTPYILQELGRLAQNPSTGKITIVAHSNGGLLTKALLKYLDDTDDPILSKIDKVIFVAVPHLGSPQAIAGLLHGYEQGIPKDFGPFISDSLAREFGQNLPGAYNFLPSSNYFNYVSTPVVTFNSALSDWTSRYGESVNSQSLHTFLTDTYGRVDSTSLNTETPVSLRNVLLTNSENVHNDLDNWTPPANIEVTEIAGWGIPSTVSGINYVKKGSSIKPEPKFTIDGDGTVVTPSALWANGASVNRYWVDLWTYNNSHLDIDHKNILEVSTLVDFIQNLIGRTSIEILPQYISTSTPTRNIGNNKRLVYSLHSPLTLDIYDNLGHHTGISTSTNLVEEQIPGTYYTQFGEDKYIFTDTGAPTHVFMNGYANGTFTFNINELEGDTLIASTTFRDIPTTPTTRVSLDIQDDINIISSMRIDTDGDGDTDFNLTPKLNGTVFLYRFSGFFQPINDTNYHPEQSKSVFKTGSTVPVKFQLKDAFGTIIQSNTAPIWLLPEKGTEMSSSIDESVYSFSATSGNIYKWDPTSEQYIYNWNTKGLQSGYWYKISAKLDDGNTYSVIVGLK